MSGPKKLKRVVIKEELFALTGDFKEAIILNQFIYWSERIRDFDKFVEEENKRRQMETGEEPIDLNNGWIFKSVKELKEEIMINLSESNLSKYINNLVEKEFLSKRRNPKYKWDKTFQYRVNLKYIQISLNKIGYCLEGYKDDRFSTISVLENGNSVLENHNSQNERAIPEITTDTTTEITKSYNTHGKPVTSVNNYYNSFSDLIKHINTEINNLDLKDSINEYNKEVAEYFNDFYTTLYRKTGLKQKVLTNKQLEDSINYCLEAITDGIFTNESDCLFDNLLDLYMNESEYKTLNGFFSQYIFKVQSRANIIKDEIA